jgi:predicted nucleotidyltransferase
LSITYYEVSVDMLVDRLRTVLSGRPELVIAVLFGSVLRRKLVRDVDVGVYFHSEESLTDVIDLSNMLEDELKLPVDVVPLHRAPPKLRLKALMGGVKLVVRDNLLYWNLIGQAFSEATDVDLKLSRLKNV